MDYLGRFDYGNDIGYTTHPPGFSVALDLESPSGRNAYP